MWIFLSSFKNASHDDLKREIGAVNYAAYFKSFLSECKHKLGIAEYRALIEILVNSMIRPGSYKDFEIFGKLIGNIKVLPCIYEMLPYIHDVNLKRDILKDMNLIIAGNKANVEAYSLSNENWQQWLFQAALDIPAIENNFTAVEAEIWKYVNTIFLQVFFYVFEHDNKSFNHVLNLTMDRLQMQYSLFELYFFIYYGN